MYAIIVQIIGLFFLLDLLACLPFFREAFSFGDKAGERTNDLRRWRTGVMWFAGAVAYSSGWEPLFLPASILLWLVFRQHFIRLRWTSPRRGFGAPGFMSHFTVLWIAVFELARLLNPDGWLVDLAFAVYRIDFAIIMICAGTYKALVGFFQGEGMEYGTVNPLWGYFWRQFKKLPSDHLIFRVNNYLGSGIEILAGILLLIPATQWIGAALVTLSFVYVGLLIRLGRLAFLMAVLPGFCLPIVVENAVLAPPMVAVATPEWLSLLFAGILIGFAVLLIPVKIMQYCNLFWNRRFPEPVQGWLTRIAATVPVIMWRVFTPDVTNFFFRVRGSTTVGNEVRPLLTESMYDWGKWSLTKLRFWHVGESIALVSTFTLRKYYPSRVELFHKRLLAYADSLRGAFGLELRYFEFECVAIRKFERKFVFEPAALFRVDLEARSIQEEILADGDPTASAASRSPVREGAAAGTYVAKASDIADS